MVGIISPAIFVNYNATVRAMEAAQRRQERGAQKRQRELERQAKEQVKLSAIEQARLEVETYESGLEVLLSVHKEQGEVWDWLALAVSLPPHSPRKLPHHELKARLQAELASLPNFRAGHEYGSETDPAKGQAADEQEFQEAFGVFSKEKAECERLTNLAPRILAGEHKAYTEALVEFSPLAELSDLGSSIYFTVHDAKLLECVLKVNGRNVIPTEVKSLTASDKLSVKAMPKARFHEIYQDYVCGCVLRVAREVFALLPVETVLVTASVEAAHLRTGKLAELPVLSVAIPRTVIARLDLGVIDPSDAMENFHRRGDFKASRKSGEFAPITPLTPADLPQPAPESLDVGDLIGRLQLLRDELRIEMETILSQSAVVTMPASEPL